MDQRSPSFTVLCYFALLTAGSDPLCAWLQLWFGNERTFDMFRFDDGSVSSLIITDFTAQGT